MQQVLGVDSVLTGFGLPDDRIHSPNEQLHLPTWYRGIEALIHFFYILGEAKA
jgi:acetylornithine deacetylase/succinyl-diaminopimelate desuccinylase-like protein